MKISIALALALSLSLNFTLATSATARNNNAQVTRRQSLKKAPLTNGQIYCKKVALGVQIIYRLCMTRHVGTGDFIDNGTLFWRRK